MSRIPAKIMAQKGALAALFRSEDQIASLNRLFAEEIVGRVVDETLRKKGLGADRSFVHPAIPTSEYYRGGELGQIEATAEWLFRVFHAWAIGIRAVSKKELAGYQRSLEDANRKLRELREFFKAAGLDEASIDAAQSELNRCPEYVASDDLPLLVQRSGADQRQRGVAINAATLAETLFGEPLWGTTAIVVSAIFGTPVDAEALAGRMVSKPERRKTAL